MKSNQSFKKLLALTMAFITTMIIARVCYTGTWHHVFLLWNIFLAWIPFALSNYFHVYRHKALWKQLVLFFTWLLFFPNALYIVTDLVHLQDNGNAPLWFDVILLFTSSLIGLIMAFASLHNTEQYLLLKFNHRKLSFFMPAILFLGAFGVYLGRFERWNSWDIIHNPVGLCEDIICFIVFPADHLRTWAVTVTLTLLFYILYGFSKLLPVKVKKYAKD